MDAAIKEEWVTALRSGNYKQGRSYLHKRRTSGDSYCCLGVLCEVAVKHGVIDPPTPRRDDETIMCYGKNLDNAPFYLPKEVIEWAGVVDERISIDPILAKTTYAGRDTRSLSHMNDMGASFSEIADVIEEQF